MFLTLNNAKLFFDVYGSQLKITADKVTKKPTLLVLHGGHGFADHTLYVEFWSQFADLAQVVFLDQRGCGRSDLGRPTEWNLPQWAEDVYQFCQTLGIEKPIIAGVSMGGQVMCEIIKQYPDFPGGFIFCNTEAHMMLKEMCAFYQKIAGEKSAQACHDFYTQPTEKTYADYMQYCLPYYGKKSYSKTELARCQKHPEVFLHYWQKYKNFNYLAEIHKIHCPTLFLVGRSSPHLVEAAEIMAKEIDPHYVTFKIFEQAGGPVYKDQPEESYATLRHFLQDNF